MKERKLKEENRSLKNYIDVKLFDYVKPSYIKSEKRLEKLKDKDAIEMFIIVKMCKNNIKTLKYKK